jgi:hypothetical protein
METTEPGLAPMQPAETSSAPPQSSEAGQSPRQAQGADPSQDATRLPATAPSTAANAATLQPNTNTPPPVPNKRIRVTLDLTPDQYAVIEQARNEQHRRQGGRRPSVEHAFTQICHDYLANGCPTARLKSQLIVHTHEEQSQHWYETERGLLPATATATTCSSAASTSAGAKGVKISKEIQNFQVEESPAPPPSRRRRPAVPRAVLRAVRARANGRCEMPGCGRGGQLHVHHLTPVSDGGIHTVDSLRLLCAACHAQHHETDFNQRPHWQRARAQAVEARSAAGRASDQGTRSG